MTALIGLLFYVLAGFLAASILVKYGDIDFDHDPSDVFLFLMMVAGWPLIVIYWTIKGPWMLLYRYIHFLQK